MRRMAASLLLLGVTLSAGEADGQEEPSPRVIAEARQAFERAVQRMRRERWAEGEAELRRSLALHPTQVAAFDLGLCVKEQGRFAEAMAIFERFLVEFGDEASEERRAEVEHELEALRAMPGYARVLVDVDGAEIYVDGRKVGTSPLADAIELPGGGHDFEARLSGYPSARAQVDVRAHAETEVRLDLGEPEAPPDAGPSGVRPIFFWTAAGVAAIGVLATTVFGVMALHADAEYRDAAVRTRADRSDGLALVHAADVSLTIAVFAGVFAGVFYTQTDWSEGMFRLGSSPDSVFLAGSF